MAPIDPNDARDEAITALVETYLRRRREDVRRIYEALAARHFDAIATIGHNLRGNGASYGFAELSALGEAIENGARAADAASIDRNAERLTAELTRIEDGRKK